MLDLAGGSVQSIARGGIEMAHAVCEGHISLLKSTYNTRELGSYLIPNGNIAKRKVLIRSDLPDFPCEEDFALLKGMGVATVIDLRTEKNICQMPSVFAAWKEFAYFNCPIEEGSGIPQSAAGVPASYLDIATAANMPSVFHCIAAAEGGVLFHCTAGKDRTGVVSAILLCHAGVKDSDVIENYVLTREYGKDYFARLHDNFPEIDMDIVTPKEHYMEEFLRLFRKRFGNTNSYFLEMGLSEAEIQGLSQRFEKA